MASPARAELTPRKLRSAITNGSQLLANCDHRTAAMRRIRDLLRAYELDMGSTLSEGQRAIIRRCVMLQVQCELMEKRWAEDEASASARDLDNYGRASGHMRRLLESLHLNEGRKQKDIGVIDNDDQVAELG
jgi:hypothetical protein